MNLIIDATNIKSGGGLTHLREILSFDFAYLNGYKNVIIFAPEHTLKQLPNKPWLIKKTHKWVNRGYFLLFLWKIFVFNRFINKNHGLIFIPGTGYSIKPYVTMCRNLLPLEYSEINRFFFSKEWIRLIILRFIHLYSYKKAFSVIFLNTYCKKVVDEVINIKYHSIIPHGINKIKFNKKLSKKFSKYSSNRPLKLIYVSTINLYKHQWQLLKAVDQLNQEGYFIDLTLIGDKQQNAFDKLTNTLHQLKNKEKINYLGSVNYDQLQNYYSDSDVFIFASTCETFGMVILEAMSCGLPVLCSKYSSMPSVFENIPIYFDPFKIESIKKSIIKVYNDDKLLTHMSKKSFSFSKKFSWKTTSEKTFVYLSSISKLLINKNS
ncbi:MAG: glycosyltransferase family 4 protein [Flavobacteriaceae bacterium]|jgi:glycosyltransferase involved in cell wall biosynthesis|nr:glycosyltransferase family 4 protein [Flavobacteriaceae bacterium]